MSTVRLGNARRRAWTYVLGHAQDGGGQQGLCALPLVAMSARRLLWWWAGACAAAGVFCAVFEAAQLFSDPVPERIDARYSPAREALREVGVAGFLSDEPLTADAGALRFHRALYGVVPTILHPGTNES